MNSNTKDLLNFAYELRKHDTENKFTRRLLEKRVEPQIFVDIIVSNKWDEDRKAMVVEEEGAEFSI